MKVPGFVGPSYVSQSPNADCEDLINFYVEEVQSPGGATKSAFYPTPGVQLIENGTSYANVSGAGRAHFAQNNTEWCVIGSYFYGINSLGVLYNGHVLTGDSLLTDEPATICGNGVGGEDGPEILVTSQGNAYILVIDTNTFTQISTLNGIAIMGDYLDGYFIVLTTYRNRVYLSDLLDGLTWDPTQWFENSASSDLWISMKVANRYIYLFGSATTQVWFDAGTYPIPFEPHPSGLIQYGCAATFSPEVVGNALCWLASTQNGRGAVIRTSGFTPELISTFAVENALAGYSTVSDAIGDSYEDRGHTFYILSLPTMNVTWVWDTQSGWAKRGTWNASRNAFDVWRPCYHAFAFGEHRVLDLRSNGIYQMSSNFYYDVQDTTVNGTPQILVRDRVSPQIVDENNLLFYSMFELDLEPGLATSYTGQGSNPVVMLRYSDDNGKTWSSELEQSAGERGDYSARLQWNRLGAARRRVFWVRFSDPVPWRIMNAYMLAKRGLKAA